MRFSVKILLLLILGLAACLRFMGLEFGLPLLQVRPDEYIYVFVCDRMARTGTLNPHFFYYPGLAFYLFYAVDWLAFQAGSFLNLQGTEGTFADFLACRPDTLIWLHRGVSAALGTLTVGVTFLLGRCLASERLGLVAAFLTAVAYLHVRDSHFGVVDVPLTFTICLALLSAVCHVKRGAFAYLLCAAALAGLAVAQKYNAAILCIALLLSHVAVARTRGRSPWRAVLSPRLLLVAGVMVVFFLAAAPCTLLAFEEFTRHLEQQMQLFQGWYSPAPFPESGWTRHLTVSLRYGLGGPLLLVALISLVFTLLRPEWRRVVMISFVLIHFFILGTGQQAYVRYMIPIIPLLCLLAADGIVRLEARLPFSRYKTTAMLAAVLALAAIPLYRTLAFDTALGREDTRLLARNWLEKNVKPEEPVMASRSMAHQIGVTLPGLTLLNHHPGLLLRNGVRYLVFAGEHPLLSGGFPGMGALLEEGVKATRVFEAHGLDPGRSHDGIYDLQDAFLMPYAGFRALQRPGPTIRIYRIGEKISASEPLPGPPRDFNIEVKGSRFHLSWKPPEKSSGEEIPPPGILCTLVFLTREADITPHFRLEPRYIFPPDLTEASVIRGPPGRYLAVISSVTLHGEGPCSPMLTLDVRE